MKSKPTLLAASVAAMLTVPAFAKQIEEIRVTADFREATIEDLPASVSVVDKTAIAQRNAQHFEDILNQAANVNFSAGASRGRFVQIRGVGERSQFKDPLDPSVGLLVDGIDLSGIALGGLLHDVQQVEVLRGPQGTRFGSHAMGGMLHVVSNTPTEETEGSISIGIGNYDSWNVGGVLSGALSDSILTRVSVSQFKSDGYIDNSFFNTDDTNDFNEASVRARLRWLASDELTVDLNAFFVDVDNGYDAFSLENTRTTGSNMPGHDRQETRAVSVNLLWEGAEQFTTQAIASWETTDLAYGFDWDWSNWDEMQPFLADFPYQGGEDNVRERDSYSLDLRLISNQPVKVLANADWVVGVYGYRKEVEYQYSDIFDDGFGVYPSSFSSEYLSERIALYGQLDWQLSDRLNASFGVRLESYENDYLDSAGIAAAPEDDMLGATMSIEYELSDDSLLYASISRGYKTGGVNGQAVGRAVDLPDTDPIASFLGQRLIFESESLLNYEVGFKGSAAAERFRYSASFFYMDREDMQANASVLFPPAEWVSYLDNVDEGNNYGLELEADWQISDTLLFSFSLGVLETELGELTVQDLDSETPLAQEGREQAHAPGYQFNLGATYQVTPNIYVNLQYEGKDEFFFSNGHDIRSDAYELVHLNVGYTAGNTQVTLWTRNLTDEDYQVRGFYFPNNPANGWINEPYFQLGEPRVLGVTGTYNF